MLPSSAFSWRKLALVLMTLTATLIPAVGAAARTAPCNGSPELCSRPFDQVTLPGSHNAMSNAEQGWNMPNQSWTIPHQLERGARAMLIDAHYGKPVVIGGKPKVADVEPEAAFNPAAGDRLYLCHASCGFGASDLLEVFGQIRAFLEANPREVLLFVVEDDVKPEDFEGAVIESGLDRFLYRGQTTEAGWPTLGEMIRDNQRVVFMHESNRTSADWYPYVYGGPMQETGYSWPPSSNPDNYTGVQFLTDPDAMVSSCVPNRGGSVAPLFLMNHWVSGDGIPGSADNTVPKQSLAEVVNTKAAMVARARVCETERGLKPTVLAVDFFGAGDVVGAARELNGVTAAPYLEFSKRPKSTTVKAGKKAIFRLTLANLGDLTGTSRICAVPPKRLAVRRCVSTKIAVRASRTVTFRLKTKARAKGHGKVTFTVTGAGDRLATKAQLKVKPKRKRGKTRR